MKALKVICIMGVIFCIFGAIALDLSWIK